MATDSKFKALTDLVHDGQAHQAGETFTAPAEQMERAIAVGMVEPVKAPSKAKS